MELNSFRLDVKIDPKNIDFLNRVFEGYDHLCLVSTVDAKEGHIKIWGYGKLGPIKRILKGMPFPYEIME
ncbi:MAG: DUF4911 domain-containing protein [Firmicutes bacterium]|nr:DUF4911 domain-containing protein [Bacillota bacterium]